MTRKASRQSRRSDERHSSSHAQVTIAGRFSKFAQRTALWTGQPIAFLLAAALIVVWIVTGPMFDYSNTWQLVINTGTTIVTFLMVFLIQNTQNRDTLAIQLKLSELVLAMKGAENRFAAIEDLSDDELQKLHDECRTRAEMTLDHIERRQGERPNQKAKPRAAAARAKSEARHSPPRKA